MKINLYIFNFDFTLKKLIAFILMVFCLSSFLISVNPIWMKKFASFKYKTDNVFFKSVKYQYGDLFGITYLSDFKIPFDQYNIKVKKQNIIRKTKLFILSDSYVYYNLKPHHFNDVDSIIWANWKDEAQSLYINKSKKNILIIETAERTFSSKFSQLTKNKYPFNPLIKVENKINPGSGILLRQNSPYYNPNSPSSSNYRLKKPQ
jgi:hypothetical protein